MDGLRLSSAVSLFFIGVSFCSCGGWASFFSSTGLPSRVYHHTKTLYNVSFNGQQSYDKALQILKQNHSDDFSRVLRLEYVEPFDTLKVSEGHINQVPRLLKRAIQKSTKAIQEYSIKSKGKEHNSLIDNIYVLLGKSHYYLRQYSSAIEAFNYVTDNFKNSDTYNEALSWGARCNLRLSNEYLVEEQMGSLYKNIEVLDKNTRAEVLEIYSQLLINLKKEAYAMPVLMQLIENTTDDFLICRYSFILGQLHQSQGNYELSNKYFNKVIDQDEVDVFVVNSKINRIKNQISDVALYQVYLREAKQILKDRRFKNYYALINYSLANIYLKDENIDGAKRCFIKCTKDKLVSKNLQTICFERLGNIYLGLGDYSKAKENYANCLASSPKNWNRKEIVGKKIDNLKEVVSYINLCRQKDSLLNLFKMTKEDKLRYLQQKKTEQRQIEDNLPESLSSYTSAEQSDALSNFYFYNERSLEYGKEEFLRIWGNRMLQDNWRTVFVKRTTYSMGSDNRLTHHEETPEKGHNMAVELEKITKTPAEVLEFEKSRNEVYYRLATVYQNKYNEYDLAIKIFKKLLSFKASQSVVMPTYYSLYIIHLRLNNNKKANYYKQKMVTLAPNSRYTEFLNDAKDIKIREEIERNTSKVEQKYKQIYKLYTLGAYARVVGRCKQMINSLFEDPMLPKLYLLKAMALGKMQNTEECKNSLNHLVKKYPESDEFHRAKQILATLDTRK